MTETRVPSSTLRRRRRAMLAALAAAAIGAVLALLLQPRVDVAGGHPLDGPPPAQMEQAWIEPPEGDVDLPD